MGRVKYARPTPGALEEILSAYLRGEDSLVGLLTQRGWPKHFWEHVERYAAASGRAAPFADAARRAVALGGRKRRRVARRLAAGEEGP